MSCYEHSTKGMAPRAPGVIPIELRNGARV